MGIDVVPKRPIPQQESRWFLEYLSIYKSRSANIEITAANKFTKNYAAALVFIEKRVNLNHYKKYTFDKPLNLAKYVLHDFFTYSH